MGRPRRSSSLIGVHQGTIPLGQINADDHSPVGFPVPTSGLQATPRAHFFQWDRLTKPLIRLPPQMSRLTLRLPIWPVGMEPDEGLPLGGKSKGVESARARRWRSSRLAAAAEASSVRCRNPRRVEAAFMGRHSFADRAEPEQRFLPLQGRIRK